MKAILLTPIQLDPKVAPERDTVCGRSDKAAIAAVEGTVRALKRKMVV